MTIDELNLLKEKIAEAEKADKRAKEIKKVADDLVKGEYVQIMGCHEEIYLQAINIETICGIANLLYKLAEEQEKILNDFNFKKGEENG